MSPLCTLTCLFANRVLRPLPAVNRIVNGQLPPSSIVDYKAAAQVHVAGPADASADDLSRLALGAAAAGGAA